MKLGWAPPVFALSIFIFKNFMTEHSCFSISSTNLWRKLSFFKDYYIHSDWILSFWPGISAFMHYSLTLNLSGDCHTVDSVNYDISCITSLFLSLLHVLPPFFASSLLPAFFSSFFPFSVSSCSCILSSFFSFLESSTILLN